MAIQTFPIQPFDYAGAVAGGQRLRENDQILQAQQQKMRSQNALQDFYRQKGPGLLSGDENALNDYARIDPEGAVKFSGEAATSKKQQLEALKTKADIILSGLNAVRNAPQGANKQALWDQIKQNIQQQYGIDTSKALQVWDDAQADAQIQQGMSLKEQLEQAQKLPQTRTIEDKGEKITQQYGGPQAGFKEIGRTPIQNDVAPRSPERQQQEIELAKVRQPNINIQQAPLSEDAIDMAAAVYRQFGQLPPMGAGPVGAANRAKVLDRAAQQNKGAGGTPADAAAQQATGRANRAALAQVSRTKAMIGSFEQTAQKNADLAASLIDKGAARSGVPMINRWIQAGRRNVTGDPDVSAFDTAITTFKNEYARVVNSATGGGVTTDSARQEIEGLLNAAQTPAQIRAVLATAKADMANRLASLEEAEKNLRGQLSGKPEDDVLNGGNAQTATPGSDIDALVNQYRTKPR